MHVLITGANGFIGRALAQRLVQPSALPDGRALTRLTLCDLRLDAPPEDDRVHRVEGDFTEDAVLSAALRTPPDVVFHLACIASGRAEENFDLGMRVNLHGSLQLLERLRHQAGVPTMVFTSSIAVYGAPMPARIDDATPLLPSLSYGAQKLAVETLLTDYDRRGWLRGRAVRLPGIVVRPGSNGAWSLFSSELIQALAKGQPCTLPVSASATLWLMSLQCCIDNLLIAASLDNARAGQRRAWTLPALHVSVAEIVEAFETHQPGSRALVRFAPRPDIEAMFGRLPPLETQAAQAAGFRHDQDLSRLLERCIANMPPDA